ncbi:PREDICTED: uncharacterized protein LOC106914092 [Poecilia mexicana]|uniref:uncharacterized protein LOC106914092 n=1 Tax=Poecilia mexicana TaxID=48701 RepID=UPI00072E1F5E|nr:PREDICTED: uncharacterized protein LOC106914092 [Poecilia mexicana]
MVADMHKFVNNLKLVDNTSNSGNAEAVLSSLTSSVKVKTNTQNTVLLQTVKAWAVGPKERKISRCLLDGGSQRSFVHRDIVRALGLPVVRQETLNLHVFGSTSPVVEKRNIVRVQLENVWNTERKIEIDAVETPEVCTAVIKVPTEPIQAEIKKRGLQLGDFPLEGANEQELQMLIGADYYWQAVTGKVQRVTDSLVAVETLFGWALQGPVTTSSVIDTTCMHISLTEDTQLSKQLFAFWEVESLGIKINHQKAQRTQKLCNISNNLKENSQGQYRLPQTLCM